MAYLIDTSALILLLRDRSGLLGPRYDALVGGSEVFLSRVTAFELLKGARDDAEWKRLAEMLDTERILECEPRHWTEAARVVMRLRRVGKTLKNPIDALIAQHAIERDLVLVHDDHDFEIIAGAAQLKLSRFGLQTP